jgi:diketogulonate reductase-like aldo/keto reductase
MALAPWGALGSGSFKKPGTDDKAGRAFNISKTGKEEKVSKVLDEIATAKNTLITSVALAYVMHKAPHTFPIVGGRKVEHLVSNIEALGLRLSEEEMEMIDNAYGFEIGFPHSFVNPKNHTVLGPRDNQFNQSWGTFDFVEGPKAVRPHEGPVEEQQENFQRS